MLDFKSSTMIRVDWDWIDQKQLDTGHRRCHRASTLTDPFHFESFHTVAVSSRGPKWRIQMNLDK